MLEEASTACRRRRRREVDVEEKRAAKALALVQVGELSSARQALEGADLAPGSDATLQELRNPVRRPNVAREPIPEDLRNLVPPEFELDEELFLRTLRSSKRGSAGGPSGMTNEHLRPLLDSTHDAHLLFLAGEQLARAHVPPNIITLIRQGRLTALQKDNGGVRGIVAGDVIRRLVGRTMARQLAEPVKAATAPFQFALSTRAGCECVAHALQGLTETDPEATVLSIDGISAFDLVSRAAMLRGLSGVIGGERAIPFVRMFYGEPSVYLWEDDHGVVHNIHQAEGGEQGDALMPLLFALGQHAALVAVQSQLIAGEKLMAFLDDIYVVTRPERIGAVYVTLQNELLAHSGIRIHGGKTRVWNSGGVRPPACDALERIARAADADENVWRGSQLPFHQQGIKVLGTPLGHPEFVRAHLDRIAIEHRTFLERIPSVPDLQSAWSLLLHCAAARATYLLRTLPPEAVARFADAHDAGLWRCMCRLLNIPEDQDAVTKLIATMPLVLGGLGLRSAARTRQAAFWASWADCLPMIRERHPELAEDLLLRLEGGANTSALGAAREAALTLTGVMGFTPPSWTALSRGARPPDWQPEDYEPGVHRGGWQHEASSRVEQSFREVHVFPRLPESGRALVRSQSGTGSGVALSVSPSSIFTRIEPQLFRVLLLRRLRISLPFSRRFCRCGRSLDAFGHHRAACPRAGVLGRRGFALESAAARICREAGGRVTTNVFVRDLDVAVPNALDGRRLEVVADGLPLFASAQLAVDTTLVSPLHADGSPHRHAADSDGAVLATARRRKERTYPELVGPESRARLVVLALETGGRWSDEALAFVRLLARAKVRSEPRILKKRVEQAWRLRWLSMLGCAGARALAASLLELRSSGGVDGPTPLSHEVEGDHRYSGLDLS